ncbi:hypothetical protein KVV02_007441 [Mortierella alpina]|uniref:Uncharacterized protein n=1 Tax=Mortierella alpina TaxID=64518 RepID=A0A9P8CUC5_MORAP|nr:hypothetical protein KVV02_007441 [Mortierella alpina]
MSLIPAVVASYTVATTHPADEADSSNSIGSLTFEAPIISAGTGSNDQELYLAALAQALSALQESVNAGLTKRLVERGILAESSETTDSTVNTKLRTKVPGQPNNSKKGQTKKQQQRAQQQNLGENQMAITTALPTQDKTATTLARESVATTMDVDPITTTLETPVLLDSDIEHQYKPKGGIYGDDDEDENIQHKDEVDLVMEADPGEVDGACLELPKDIEVQQQGQQQHNKKRNELPSETASDAAAAKKSRGSESA